MRVATGEAVITVLGSLFGGIAATISAGLFGSLLFGVAPLDVQSLTSAIGIAAICTTLASLSPALRAAATDPAAVLQAE